MAFVGSGDTFGFQVQDQGAQGGRVAQPVSREVTPTKNGRRFSNGGTGQSGVPLR